MKDPKIQQIYLEKGFKEKREKGVPQGAPTSCGLSTMNLREVLLENNVIMYADDGILFTETHTEEPEVSKPEAGIIKSPGKSH